MGGKRGYTLYGMRFRKTVEWSGKLKLDTEGVENWTRETVFWIGY